MTAPHEGLRRIAVLAALFAAGAMIGAIATNAVTRAPAVLPADLLVAGAVDVTWDAETDAPGGLTVHVFNRSDEPVTLTAATVHPWPPAEPTQSVTLASREWTSVHIDPVPDCDVPGEPQLDLRFDGDPAEPFTIELTDVDWLHHHYCAEEDWVASLTVETEDVTVGADGVTTVLHVTPDPHPYADPIVTSLGSGGGGGTHLLQADSTDLPVAVPPDGATITVTWTLDTCLEPGLVPEVHLGLIAGQLFVGEWWPEPRTLATLARYAIAQCDQP